VRLMLVMLSGPLPVLLSVTVCAVLVVPAGWLPKERLLGAKPAAGAVPVPVRATVWGLPVALSATDRLAAGAAPLVVGE